MLILEVFKILNAYEYKLNKVPFRLNPSIGSKICRLFVIIYFKFFLFLFIKCYIYIYLSIYFL